MIAPREPSRYRCAVFPKRSQPTLQEQRDRMVRAQLIDRGITDPRVLDAMAIVPRERFIDPSLAPHAYEDRALPIAEHQTISQPYIVALMAQALCLGPEDRVLEIGAGSGYAAAVMSLIAAEVIAIERHATLAESARARLADLGFDRVRILIADGTLGAPDLAPFDAISVAAGGPRISEPLFRQLAIGGRLVMPVGASRDEQHLVRIMRTGEDAFARDSLGLVQFVPLVGREGWSDTAPD